MTGLDKEKRMRNATTVFGAAGRAVAAVLIPAAVLACSTAGPRAEAPAGTPGAAPTAAEAAKREAQRDEAKLEAARAEVRRADTRVISLRLLKGEAKAEGVTFAGAAPGMLDVVTASRVALSGLMAPGSGATVVSAPQVMGLVGQECAVTVGDSKQGTFTFKVTVLPSEAGMTRLKLGYEEGPELARTYVLQGAEVAFKEGEGAAVRIAGPDGKEPRIVMVTVDPAPAAGKVGR